MGRLYKLQILDGESYANVFELKTKKTLLLKSTRGNIYDRNGNLLAGNKLAYSAILEDNGEYQSNRERQLVLNSVAYRLIMILETNKEKLNNELEIVINEEGNYEYSVSGTSLKRFKADIFGRTYIEDMTPEEADISAEDMVSYLSSEKMFSLYSENKKAYTDEELEEYLLEKKYSKEELLGIIGIRYMLFLNSYQKYLPVIIAKDVSEVTIACIMENRDVLQGVDIQEDYIRVYEGGEAFAHLMGYTGKISTDELEELKNYDEKYSFQSVVGKSGIEQYMEKTLQGKDGEKEVYVNNTGRVLSEEEIISAPVTGADVYLSIDRELQEAVYKMLEQRIAGILLSNIMNTKEFDKSNINDASEIKIPIYEVYDALFQNGIIDLERMKTEESTGLEKSIIKRLSEKKAEVLTALRDELTGGSTIYKELPKEMQAYESFIVDKLGLLAETAVSTTDETYKSWQNNGDISLKEFLMYAIKMNWIDLDALPSKEDYLTSEEVYQGMIEEINRQLEANNAFDRSIMTFMLLDDTVSGIEVCNLLYEQSILPVDDSDYETLQNGNMGPYEFLKIKIEKLELTPAQLALDPYSGSAVVIEAKTGKVLACVTYPGYDNNRLANVMDDQYYYQLYQDLSAPFYNRATQQLTAPGSTFKPITVIAGMEEGVIKSGTSKYCDGTFDQVFPALNCWNKSGHGEIVNAASALENSCNDYLCDISYQLGKIDHQGFDDDQALGYLQKYSELFDLNKKSGIEITESSPQISDNAAIPSSIGQGTHNYSTVQLARYANTLATHGTSYKLSLLEDQGIAPEEHSELTPQIESQIILPDNVWNTVESGMRQFIQSIDLFKDINLSIAGKSGTAQEAKNRPDHALFIGYAPAEEPEITMAVRIANGYASGNAVALGKDILSYYFNLSSESDMISGNASGAYNTRTD